MKDRYTELMLENARAALKATQSKLEETRQVIARLESERQRYLDAIEELSR